MKGYLATYADVAAAGVNPLTNFNEFGRHEGRDPSVDFERVRILRGYPDVARVREQSALPLPDHRPRGRAERFR